MPTRLLLILAALAAQPVASAPLKQAAAPPSDIISGRVVLPDPASTPTVSTSALIPITIGEQPLTQQITVDARGARLALLPAEQGAWSVALRSPEGEQLVRGRDAGLVVEQADGLRHGFAELPWAAPGRQFDRFDFETPGPWTLEISADRPSAGFVLIDSGPSAALRTHTVDRRTLAGEPVRLRTRFDDGIEMTALSATVRSPSGIERLVRGDVGSGTIRFVSHEAGLHAVHVSASGETAEGDAVLLTTQHAIEIEEPATPLGRAVPSVSGSVLLEFAAEPDPRRAILAAEVWGMRAGEPEPVCWLSRICEHERSLELDTRWIAMAGVDPATLELRNVRLHDADSFVLLERLDRVDVGLEGLVLGEAPADAGPDMLRTVVRTNTGSATASQAEGPGPSGHALLLSHGYCSGGNPFPLSHFTGNVATFNDPNQSRSHDQFAQLILQQTQSLKSFGMVAHSQGGLAALHLYTYYWSGLDWSRGERLIQSVGSPYQGTALAGNAAVLGDLFGAGCGSNSDLTYDGAASWLSLIPSWARAEVSYWTTSAEPGLFSWCEFATSLLLSAPEDGVVERSAGQLPGASNMGHLEGWCHTSGMNDPSQTTDLSRNTEMNARARR